MCTIFVRIVICAYMYIYFNWSYPPYEHGERSMKDPQVLYDFLKYSRMIMSCDPSF